MEVKCVMLGIKVNVMGLVILKSKVLTRALAMYNYYHPHPLFSFIHLTIFGAVDMLVVRPVVTAHLFIFLMCGNKSFGM